MLFLGPQGCTVHPDRPLACRLYPLARWTSPEGEESFGHLEPHPQTAGLYGTSGTVDNFLTSQGCRSTSQWPTVTAICTTAWSR